VASISRLFLSQLLLLSSQSVSISNRHPRIPKHLLYKF
jgi:hypothetical protein